MKDRNMTKIPPTLEDRLTALEAHVCLLHRFLQAVHPGLANHTLPGGFLPEGAGNDSEPNPAPHDHASENAPV